MTILLDEIQRDVIAKTFRSELEAMRDDLLDSIDGGEECQASNSRKTWKAYSLQYALDRIDDLERKIEAKPALPPIDAYINKLEPGEPHFLLMGRDPFAPHGVYAWIEAATRTGESEEKLRQAYAVAAAMEVWGKRNQPDTSAE